MNLGDPGRHTPLREALLPGSGVASGAGPAGILVVGLGNPILGDDGVGWRVVEELQPGLRRRSGAGPRAIDVEYLSLGGLRLMERMLGHQHVIVVDSMQTGAVPAGSLRVCRLEDLPLPEAGHLTSAHDMSLQAALALARAAGAPTPDLIDIVAIEVPPGRTLSEDLSPTVADAVPLAAAAVMRLLSMEVR